MSANLAVLSKDRSQLRIPKLTPTGEVLLFVDLAQVTSHTPEQVEAMAISLGYLPELRIVEYTRSGQSALEPVLLVYQGSMGDELLLDAWETLATQIQPSTAVHLRSGDSIFNAA